MTDDSAPRRGSAPRLPLEILRDEHVDVIGLRGARVLIRLLIASRGSSTAWSSAGWIASDFSRRSDGTLAPRRHDASGVRHTLKLLETEGYLRRTGSTRTRVVDGRPIAIYEFELLRSRWEAPAQSAEVDAAEASEPRDMESRHLRGVIQSPPARDTESRAPVTQNHASREEATGEVRAAAARANDAPPAAAAEPIPTEDSNLASFFDPMPLELARAWFAWWMPTRRGGLSETWAMGERHRAIKRVVAAWEAYPEPETWRAMFAEVSTGELRGIAGMDAALRRISATRAQQRAPLSAAASALPPEQRCAVAGCTAQATHQHRTSGARYCGAHAALAARRDPILRGALEEIGDGEPAAALAAAATTREPREAPIVQQRARERPPRASAAERATA